MNKMVVLILLMLLLMVMVDSMSCVLYLTISYLTLYVHACKYNYIKDSDQDVRFKDIIKMVIKITESEPG